MGGPAGRPKAIGVGLGATPRTTAQTPATSTPARSRAPPTRVRRFVTAPPRPVTGADQSPCRARQPIQAQLAPNDAMARARTRVQSDIPPGSNDLLNRPTGPRMDRLATNSRKAVLASRAVQATSEWRSVRWRYPPTPIASEPPSRSHNPIANATISEPMKDANAKKAADRHGTGADPAGETAGHSPDEQEPTRTYAQGDKAGDQRQ